MTFYSHPAASDPRFQSSPWLSPWGYHPDPPRRLRPVPGHLTTNYSINPASPRLRRPFLPFFAYGGTPGFFSIASEMRNPREYTKALVACQSVVTITYVTVGIIVYYYAGSYVTSPAIGSAGPVVKKAAYGIALPGLFATSILLIHVSALPPLPK